MPPHEPTPDASPRRLPAWAMGLANTPTGFVYGFISTAMGILLSARGVSLATIGAISFLAFSPTFWAWTLSPVLDVRFTKRTYGFTFAALAALLLGAAVLSLQHTARFEALLTSSCVCAVLYSTSVAGAAPDALGEAEYDTMSAWFNTANLGAAGLFSTIVVLLVRHLPLPLAAFLLAALVFAPSLLLLWFPAPRRPEGTLAANFSAMGRDLRRVLRGGRIWMGLLIFLTPIAFALTNLFSSMGADFGAPESWVTGLNGMGVATVCSLGCLLAMPLCRRFKRRTVYELAGVGAALFAVALGVLPRTLAVYAIGLLGYNLFQGFNYTAFVALEFEIVGPGNALAGTMMAILTASANVPISSMTWIDGVVHDRFGLRAMYFADAAAAILTAAVLLLWAFPRMDSWVARREARVRQAPPA